MVTLKPVTDPAGMEYLLRAFGCGGEGVSLCYLAENRGEALALAAFGTAGETLVLTGLFGEETALYDGLLRAGLNFGETRLGLCYYEIPRGWEGILAPLGYRVGEPGEIAGFFAPCGGCGGAEER